MDHGPICATICKREKKIPIKKKKILPAPHPKLTPKGTVAKVLLAGAKHRAGTLPGGFLLSGPGKVRGAEWDRGDCCSPLSLPLPTASISIPPGVFHSSGPLHMPCSCPRTRYPFAATSLMLFGWPLQQDLSCSAALPSADGNVGKSGVGGPIDEGLPFPVQLSRPYRLPFSRWSVPPAMVASPAGQVSPTRGVGAPRTLRRGFPLGPKWAGHQAV